MPNPQTTQKLNQLLLTYEAQLVKYRIAFQRNDGIIDGIEEAALDEIADMIQKIKNELVLRNAGSTAREVTISEDLQELRQEVRRALDQYVETLEAEARAVADWLLANWLDFFLRTTSKPGLSASQDLIKKTLGGALSAGTNEALKALGKRAASGLAKSLTKAGIIAGATAIGGTIGSVPGAIIGFLVGVIIDVCVNLIWDLLTPNGEMLAVMRTNAAVRGFFSDIQTQIIAEREKQINLLNEFAENSRKAIDIHENTDELLEVLGAMRTTTNSINSPVVNDRSLTDALLKLWVKENAGDDSNDPNKYGAAEEQWEEAVEHLQDRNYLPEGDGIVNQHDVFVHQLRSELIRLGLNIQSHPYTLLLREAAAMQSQSTATMVLNYFDEYELTFTQNDIENPQNFIQHCNYTCGWSDMSTRGAAAVHDKKPITFKIKLDLTEDEGSVFIDSFDYRIHFRSEDLEWHAIAKASWSENID